MWEVAAAVAEQREVAKTVVPGVELAEQGLPVDTEGAPLPEERDVQVGEACRGRRWWVEVGQGWWLSRDGSAAGRGVYQLGWRRSGVGVGQGLPVDTAGAPLPEERSVQVRRGAV
jgi:hypothetical protein